jgi:hypothetical protein
MRFASLLLICALCAAGCRAPEKPAAQSPAPAPRPAKLVAKAYNSGFVDSHDTYNGMSTASDGTVYYVLCSEKFDVAGQVYSFNPASEKVEHLGDLNEACGEKDMKAVSQGKSHVRFVESNGKLYFATHVGYYTIRDGMETMGDPPPGYKPYQGGHFLSYDPAARKFENLAIAPHGEGILSMTMDTARGRIFGLTWPTGYLLRYDLADRKMREIGTYAKKGENGKGAEYRTLCRSLTIDPDSGVLYFTIGDGAILRYVPEKDAVETVEGADLVKDYFGIYDPTSPGHMGYNWRQTFWYAPEKVIYGVHGNSGYLFRFDPKAPAVDVIERLTSLPSKKAGMFDQFSYGYLGFELGPDGHTIHYLTGGPIYEEGKRVEGKKSTAKGEAKGRENLHLVTFDIPEGKYTDQGPIFLENGDRPAYVNSIAVGKDGDVYTLSRITEQGKTRTDLLRVKGPFGTPTH